MHSCYKFKGFRRDLEVLVAIFRAEMADKCRKLASLLVPRSAARLH